MDKKKVIELIEQISNTLNWHITATTESDYNAKSKVLEQLEEVKSELSKSDWVSVKDDLPEYGEMVWVRSKEDAQLIWSAFRTKNKAHEVDENCFLKPAVLNIRITHWKPIDKLEV